MRYVNTFCVSLNCILYEIVLYFYISCIYICKYVSYFYVYVCVSSDQKITSGVVRNTLHSLWDSLSLAWTVPVRVDYKPQRSASPDLGIQTCATTLGFFYTFVLGIKLSSLCLRIELFSWVISHVFFERSHYTSRLRLWIWSSHKWWNYKCVPQIISLSKLICFSLAGS